MDNVHRKRLVIALLTLLIVFVAIFFMTLYNYFAGEKTLAIGLQASTQNIIIMILCTLSLFNVVIELKRIN